MARFATNSTYRAPNLRREGFHFLNAAGEAWGATRHSRQKKSAIRTFSISLGNCGHCGLPPAAMAGH
jgi:hypothetical protein